MRYTKQHMPLRASFVVVSLAVGAAACASIVSLDSIGPGSQAKLTDNDAGEVVGGGAVTTDAGVTIDPGSLDFKSSPCGAHLSAPINLKNTTGASLAYTVTVATGGSFALEGADANGAVTGTLEAGHNATVTVDANASTFGSTTSDVLVRIGDDTTTVKATLETHGGNLVFDPPLVNFGTTRASTASAAQTVTFRNTGNQDVTIDHFTAADDFSSPTAIQVPAGGTSTGQFQMPAGTAGAPLTENAIPVLSSGSLCGAPELPLEGTRVSGNVTLSATSLNMGSPTCGDNAPAAQQTITLSNFFTGGSASFVATLPAQTVFSVSPAGTTNIPAATDDAHPGTATLQVGVVSVPATAGVHTETLSVVVTSGGVQTPTNVTLNLMVQGATVALDSTTTSIVAFTSPIGIGTGEAHVGIKNTGLGPNLCVGYTVDDPQIFFYNGTSATLQPQTTGQKIDMAFNQQKNDNANQAIVTITPKACSGQSAPATVCGPIPTLTVTYAPPF